MLPRSQLGSISLRALLTATMLCLLILPHLADAQTLSSTATNYKPECQSLSALEQLIGLNIRNLLYTEPKYDQWSIDGLYFCGQDAPKYLRCDCGLSDMCYESRDPWGHDMGECGCCATWLVALLVSLGVLSAVALIACIYTCFFDGLWFFNGYPKPTTPLLPSRTATFIAPATFPIPAHAFGVFPSEDFDGGALAAPEERRQTAAAVASGATEGDRQETTQEENHEHRRREIDDADEEMALISPTAESAVSLRAIIVGDSRGEQDERMPTSVSSPLYQLPVGNSAALAESIDLYSSPNGTSSTRPLLASTAERAAHADGRNAARPPWPTPPKAPPARFLMGLLRGSNQPTPPTAAQPHQFEYEGGNEDHNDTFYSAPDEDYGSYQHHNPFGAEEEMAAQYSTPNRHRYSDASAAAAAGENPLNNLNQTPDHGADTSALRRRRQ